MSAPESTDSPKSIFARLLAWVGFQSDAAVPDVTAVIAPEMPGEVFFASQPEPRDPAGKIDGA